MHQIPYNRSKALAYAKRWAFKRNPAYFNFDALGGDCTNFVSQCIFAGTGVMNFTKDVGWYYRSAYDRAAAWTGVEYFYRFMTENTSVGPFGRECGLYEVQSGDVIQLGNSEGWYYHTLLVMQGAPKITVAAHSQDALNRELSSYSYEQVRCIHIQGGRQW